MVEAAAGAFTATAGGVCVALRLQPGARTNAATGPDRLADGRVVLKTQVSAAPEGGKANAALIALLARSWRLPKSAFCLVAGPRARLKTLEVTGDSDELIARLTAWLAALPRAAGR